MEAAGSPAPAAPPPPPPTSSAVGQGSGASGGWRILAVVLALALAFASAVLVVAMSEIGDTPPCEDVRSGEEPLPADGECFDGSEGKKTVALVLGWPSAVLAGVAALLAIFFAATGRRGRLLMMLTGAAIALGGLSIAVGSI